MLIILAMNWLVHHIYNIEFGFKSGTKGQPRMCKDMAYEV